jgi:hypothetical protein
VVNAPDYAPASQNVTIGPGTVNTQNFTNVSGSGMGTFSISVDISSGGDDQYATLSFRKADGGQTIEVYSINIKDGTIDSPLQLPAGTYTVVASSYGFSPQIAQNTTLASGGTTPLNVTF